jgi:hypothetical protein
MKNLIIIGGLRGAGKTTIKSEILGAFPKIHNVDFGTTPQEGIKELLKKGKTHSLLTEVQDIEIAKTLWEHANHIGFSVLPFFVSARIDLREKRLEKAGFKPKDAHDIVMADIHPLAERHGAYLIEIRNNSDLWKASQNATGMIKDFLRGKTLKKEKFLVA